MKIQDALKETGKAVFPREVGVYAEITFDRGANFLSWVDIESKTHEGIVAYETHFSDDWLPYHEDKEIKPERAGELWEHETRGIIFIYEGSTSLNVISEDGIVSFIEGADLLVHNKNGWTRLYPPVEDEGVERIEIFTNVDKINPVSNDTRYEFSLPSGYLERIDGQKLVLEIPKDSK